MPHTSSKRKTHKAKRDELSKETFSKDTREVESLTDQIFEDKSGKVETNFSKKLKEQDYSRVELWKMISDIRSQMEVLVNSRLQKSYSNRQFEPLVFNVDSHQGGFSGTTPLRDA